MEDYKSNSHKAKAEAKEAAEKKVNKVVTGNVKRKKKSGSANSIIWVHMSKVSREDTILVIRYNTNTISDMNTSNRGKTYRL